ncbi:ATP-binding protein [Helicobacter sp. 11S03491-1]|uniref:ATP-binding protein n=1 Tax=Helicobacter sp. 11S03491-1 TaxID=1476196 RepID=UPI000BA76F48|nr:ATP-binding protein [Helicobacter sp. 11S03491-1]PAF42723.1 hypothetical protein BKH45_04225 [Helicobacter sp. 11S03491-1]
MQDLEENFLEKTQNFSILPRRFGLKRGKIHLYGAPKCGKTSIALDFAKHFKKPIYIDCKDPRVDIDLTKSLLLKIYLEKNIDILILDNYICDFPLPNLENIILITPSKNTNNITLPHDFISKQIHPLNFEEYVSFDKKNLSITTLFNHFLKDGNLPEIQYLYEYQKIPRKQEINSLAFEHKKYLFGNLLSYQARQVTTNQIYTQLKKQIKISKDKIYQYIHEFQQDQVIYFLPHIQDPSKPKKIYFYDFSLPYAFSATKSFQSIFENMIFLELLCKNKTLYYDQGCEFITQDNHAYLAFAFPTPQTIEEKIKKIQTKYSKITLITINYQSGGKTPYSQWQAISFINFALDA